MAKKRKRGKREVDKWKTKKWYEVVAPEVFEHKGVGGVISSNPENLVNRVVVVPVADIVGGKSPEVVYSNIKFRIKEVKNDKALTNIIGYETAFSYLRALAKRRRSVIHEVVDIKTKDGAPVRVKVVMITHKKVSSTMKKNLRKALVDKMVKEATSRTYDELIKETLSGAYTKSIYGTLNKVVPVQYLLVKKIELKEVFT